MHGARYTKSDLSDLQDSELNLAKVLKWHEEANATAAAIHLRLLTQLVRTDQDLTNLIILRTQKPASIPV